VCSFFQGFGLRCETKADIMCDSVFGVFWKCARIGERLSPYVSICCVVMAVSVALRIFVVGEG